MLHFFNTEASNAFAGREWGQKAHEDLIVTRGKGFTKEKNKKKKGTYYLVVCPPTRKASWVEVQEN